jgi:hypothetical protein
LIDQAVLWRAFPWDPEALAGTPFSPSYVPLGQGTGRFDVAASMVLYLAETPEHAVAEKIQRFRGRTLRSPHLRQSGRRLALAPVRLSDPASHEITDLCDPDELARRRIRPDTLASRDYDRTRAVAESLYAERKAGLRWWSAFSGDWHTVVVFCGRLGGSDLAFGEPEPVGLDHVTLRRAAAELGVRLAPQRRGPGAKPRPRRFSA